MKKLTVIFVMLCVLQLSAQETITGMEWWLAGDEQNRNYLAINPQIDFDGVVPLDLSSLADGRYHVLFRFKSLSAKWSPVFQHRFTKTPEGVSLITAYQFWTDTDFEKIVTVDLEQPVNTLDGSVDLDMSDFPVGQQRIFLRFKDSNGQWGSVHSQLITKTPAGDESVYIAAYEYWFNNEISSSLWGFFDSKPTVVDSVLPLDLTSLDIGSHMVSVRFYNNLGQVSSVHRNYIRKLPMGFSQNQMIAYRYWFNDDVLSINRVDFAEPLVDQNVAITLSMDQFAPGEKVLVSLQFLDNLGQWSAIHADSVNIYDPTFVNNSPDGTNQMLIYPNPSRGKAFFEWTGSSLASNTLLSVIDLEGKERFQQLVNPDDFVTSINLHSLSRGVYFVVMVVDGIRYSRRLVIID
jgi:hypothetical protein